MQKNDKIHKVVHQATQNSKTQGKLPIDEQDMPLRRLDQTGGAGEVASPAGSKKLM